MFATGSQRSGVRTRRYCSMDSAPYGHVKNAAVGLWNLGVKAAGGAASLPYLLDSPEAARAVQDWFGGARLEVDAPFAELVSASLAPTMNDARAWSEGHVRYWRQHLVRRYRGICDGRDVTRAGPVERTSAESVVGTSTAVSRQQIPFISPREF